MSTETQEPIKFDKANSWRMFNKISPRYDFLNHFLSFCLDIHWRAQLGKYLPAKTGLKALDLATGTGDVLISLIKKNPNVKSGVGIDMANKMLEIGRAKVKTLKLVDRIELKYGNANSLPLDDNTFDVTTMAFGIRNIEDPTQTMREMYRVLNKGGRTLILEFSLPKNVALRSLHLFYLRFIVPVFGALISGNYSAYKYLNKTIETFPYGDAFCKLLEESGFSNVKANPISGGIATIYQGDKSE